MRKNRGEVVSIRSAKKRSSAHVPITDASASEEFVDPSEPGRRIRPLELDVEEFLRTEIGVTKAFSGFKNGKRRYTDIQNLDQWATENQLYRWNRHLGSMILKPIKAKTLGVFEGKHFRTPSNGRTPR